MDKELLKDKFIELFGQSDEPIRTFFAPGRVNLIGDHIDYNGGKVLPVAISLGTTVLIRKRQDRTIRLQSLEDPLRIVANLDDEIKFNEEAGWGNYPLAVVKYLKLGKIDVPPADILLSSNLPIGAGLSSSASIEIATGYSLMKLAEHDVDRIALALLCQKAENEFIGVASGIMDQFVVANGKKQMAIFLDCNTLEHNFIKFVPEEFRLIIINSNIQRSLASSKYNLRKLECLKALQILQKHRPIENLSKARFSEIEELIDDNTLKSRARHVVWENQYVYEAVEAIEDNDWIELGQSFNASHMSLSNDFEVSTEELDILVDSAAMIDGCLGARLTGAGFGGCVIALVHKDSVDSFQSVVNERYLELTDKKADFFECQIVDGVTEI